MSVCLGVGVTCEFLEMQWSYYGGEEKELSFERELSVFVLIYTSFESQNTGSAFRKVVPFEFLDITIKQIMQGIKVVECRSNVRQCRTTQANKTCKINEELKTHLGLT